MNRHKLTVAGLAALLLSLSACTPTPTDVTDATTPLAIYPDYQGITVPCNIAPLNFMLLDEATSALAVTVSDGRGEEVARLHARGGKAIWDPTTWQQLLAGHCGDSLHVSVTARIDGQWLCYPDFGWYVSPDSLDSYLTYRLIEPGYEVWDKVCIEERCTENFETRLLADGNTLGNRCMNCHTHGGDRGQYSFFHLRGKGGGTLLQRDGRLRKLTLKKDSMMSAAVYGELHPTGRYGVYSNNVIIPAFHSQANRRLEVYDTTSDLCVTDFDHNRIQNYIDPGLLMTFPCFSADGGAIYFCAAPNPCGDTIPTANDLQDRIQDLHYSLCRMPFDAQNGWMKTDSIETVYDAQQEGGSVNFPKCSPDGTMLCFTRSDCGTFPIWHRESRLCLLVGDTLIVTPENGTYHTWSHNSRWLAFASKRCDGQYGRTYFMHVAPDGSLSRPLVLPQADPENDILNLRSYNIPDLSTVAMPFDTRQVELLLDNLPSETFE